MAKPKVIGPCHICGTVGPLSKEHVPPKAAFNNGKYMVIDAEQLWSLGPDGTPHGKTEQGGVGMNTLCEKCNNDTGAWYGQALVNFCKQGDTVLQRSGGKPSLVYLYRSHPLRIIKQVATMFFSVNPAGFANKHPELVDFVLNKTKKFLPPHYRFYVYYNIEGRWRYTPISGILKTDVGQMHTCSEITYPPFGYIMALKSSPPDKRPVDITHFAWYGYEETLDVELQLPVLPTYLAYPGDYRTKKEIYEQAGIAPQT